MRRRKLSEVQADSQIEETCLTLGVFDGVHLGHQRLIQRLVECAQASGRPAALLTFDPHPQQILSPSPPPLLTTTAEKAMLIKELGVETLVVAKFDQKMAQMPAEQFIEEILYHKLKARQIVIGAGFRFGQGGGGDEELLREQGERLGFQVEIVEPAAVEGVLVSSTAIRSLLAKGEVARAGAFLGRWFRAEGEVVPGSGRGANLGFPTANLQPPPEKVIPTDGVYAVWTGPPGGTLEYQAVANIGCRPTFRESKRILEVHLLSYDSDRPLKRLAVDFVERLRDEKEFPSARDLQRQMEADCQQAKDILLRQEGPALHPPGDVIKWEE